MALTPRQRVEAAIRHATAAAVTQAETTRLYLRLTSGSYRWDIAFAFVRIVRTLRMVPLGAPDAVQRARAALAVYDADPLTRPSAEYTLRALRGHTEYDKWWRERHPRRIPR